MHRLFASVVAPLIEAGRPQAIAEVGAGAGRLTRRLLEAPGAAEAAVHAIDPAPTLDPDLCRAEAARLVVHAGRGSAVLGAIGPVDLALLDGDPNWHSVHSELRLLARTARAAEREAPLIAVHNAHWPFGRRDGYYEPEAIPLPQRREHTGLGLVPGRGEPAEEGLRLAPWSAVREFEPRSGVLTAVEDFIAGSDLDWTLVEVPGFHGVAVLAEAERLRRQPALAAALGELRSPRFLGRQARRAEAARLEAELELAEARRLWPQGAPTPKEAAEPVQVPAEPEPQVPTAERDALVAEAAREQARREALEWQLERLEEDLAERGRRLDAAQAELDAERQALTAARVRLEGEAGELRSEREAGERLRRRVRELEQELAARDRRLDEAEEAKRLAQGRLAHSQDLAGALREEGDRLRAEVERLRTEAGATRASLAEVAVHLDRAARTRRARVARRLRRLAAPFRRPSPTALEEAQAAATGALPPAPSAPAEEAEENQVEARTR